MMSNFGKIRHRNGSFLVDYIFLEHLETIKVVGGEGGIVNGLEFIVYSSEAHITDHWMGGESLRRVTFM